MSQLVRETMDNGGVHWFIDPPTQKPTQKPTPKAKDTVAEMRQALTALMVALSPAGRDQVVAELSRGAKQTGPAGRHSARLALRQANGPTARPQLIDTPENRAAARAWLGLGGGAVVDDGERVTEQQTPGRALIDTPATRQQARALFNFDFGGQTDDDN